MSHHAGPGLWNMLEICFGRETEAHLNLCTLAKGLWEQQPPRSALGSGRGDGEVGVQLCVCEVGRLSFWLVGFSDHDQLSYLLL